MLKNATEAEAAPNRKNLFPTKLIPASITENETGSLAGLYFCKNRVVKSALYSPIYKYCLKPKESL